MGPKVAKAVLDQKNERIEKGLLGPWAALPTPILFVDIFSFLLSDACLSEANAREQAQRARTSVKRQKKMTSFFLSSPQRVALAVNRLI